ncbi:hypothetical protein H5410_064422 [Solanum commersonii]|uniref:Uncharacterized protein n=1 Tax=Solanum commersonii TaxID=4109 RepID=A0A9J5VZG1_SOLCO|nr:hypothetical protein H5410_064422 [Solanum commersonii]
MANTKKEAQQATGRKSPKNNLETNFTTKKDGNSTNSISNNLNHNSFTNQYAEAQNDEKEEHTSNERVQAQETQNRPVTGPNQTNQVPQNGNKEYSKSTGIDSMLPIPTPPNNVSIECNDEVEGGMDGGSREKHSNMRKGYPKGNLTHVLHEGTHDHSPRP